MNSHQMARSIHPTLKYQGCVVIVVRVRVEGFWHFTKGQGPKPEAVSWVSVEWNRIDDMALDGLLGIKLDAHDTDQLILAMDQAGHNRQVVFSQSFTCCRPI